MTPPPDGREPSDADPGRPGPGRAGRPDEGRPGDSGVDPDGTMRLVSEEPVAGPGNASDPEPAPKVTDAEHNPSLNGLGKTLRRGATISAAMLFVTQVIALSQTIVVARLLSPAEIGVFTLGTMFSNYLVTMAGGGMKAALIQRGEDIEDAANTAFWASVLTGVAMATIALASAPLLGMFFDDQMVGLIAAATCGTLLVHALLNVPEALMQRRFNFKRKLIVDPITSGSFALVAIVGALMGYGVWGLVAALYASQIATLIASWTLAGWRPGKGRPRYGIWREMAKFSFPLIVQGVSQNLRESAQPAIVGRLLGADPAGQFRYGKRIGILPGQAIIQIASYVLFPAFSRIADDAARFRRGFLRALRLLWTATLPLGVLLATIGGPAIVVLLGPEWAPAGVFVAAMAGFGPGTALNAVSGESIKGAGHSRLLHRVTITSLVIGIGGLFLLIWLGMGLLGVGLAVSLEGLVAGLVTLALARPLVGVSWGELGRVMVPPLVSSVVAGAAVAVLEHGLLHSASRSVPVGLLFLALDFLVFLGLYLLVLSFTAPATVRELRDLLVKFRRRRSGGGGEPSGDRTETPDDPQDPDGARARRGEDDLLDAPTVILALWDNPETQRMVALRASRPGPPPGEPPARPARPPSVPPPAIDARTTVLAPVEPAPTETLRPEGAWSAENGTGRNGHAGTGQNGHTGHGHTNGHAGDGHTANGHTGNGHTADGPADDGPADDGPDGDGDGPPGAPPSGGRRLVPMTQHPPSRRRR
ncbi:lipopolysaccharide biosynthesis protein [Actinomycetospora lemnae]|uniref:Lipopolysaccharide biosynthesis protein n=1 Tax=Actinomycetospora lemnae TaxID=3019891 RepID=A0ABT5SV29_9PSEU|nr:lipopolysaccharide biosynthesis protein [Actinomycetospora sp. DW7H6]MDD7966715.1 lipopolysaccharide biosynthesis protein [Actinomycetospora sp. DW7H6]